MIVELNLIIADSSANWLPLYHFNKGMSFIPVENVEINPSLVVSGTDNKFVLFHFISYS